MFKGTITPMVTVFDKNGKLDFEGNKRVINHVIDGGVSGILFLGSIGEFFTMTKEEKKEFASFAVKAVNGRVPVLIGTGGTVVEEVVELTKYAEKEGADAVVAISPYYFKLDDESLYRYYAEIASSVKMPVLLYNFPDRTAVSLDPELVVRLAKDFDNIVGIKDTVDNISHTRKLIKAVKAVRKDFSILSGFDEYLIPNLMAGGDGVICGLTNIVPASFAKLYKAYSDKDFKTIAGIQQKVNTLMGLYDVSQPFVGAIKAAVALTVGGIEPAVRKPAGVLNEAQIEKIRSIFREAGVM